MSKHMFLINCSTHLIFCRSFLHRQIIIPIFITQRRLLTELPGFFLSNVCIFTLQKQHNHPPVVTVKAALPSPNNFSVYTAETSRSICHLTFHFFTTTTLHNRRSRNVNFFSPKEDVNIDRNMVFRP